MWRGGVISRGRGLLPQNMSKNATFLHDKKDETFTTAKNYPAACS